MAKSFSIHQALSEAVNQYRQNWLLLIVAGAIASVGILVDYNTHQHLTEIKAVKEQAKMQPTAQGAWDVVKTYAKDLGQKHNPLNGNFMGLIMLLVLVYLHLGFVRVCLQAAQKGKVSLQNFLSTPQDFFTLICVSLLVIAIIIGFVVALSGAMVLLNWFALPESVLFLIGAILVSLFIVYLAHFSFAQICLADKSQGVVEVLAASKAIVTGNLGRILGFFIVASIFVSLVNVLVLFLLGKVTVFIPVKGLSDFLSTAFIMPLTVLSMVSVYRQLK